MIKVINIKKQYNDKTTALRGISFIADKKITSIIGRNGAGKTTLLRILTTQLLPSSGSALINNFDIVKETNMVRGSIVSIPQEAKPIEYLSAFDSVRLYLAARGIGIHSSKVRAEAALKTVGLWNFKNKLADELSGGMKRKIFVAMALAADAEITFLDEPTTGLDPVSRMEVWSAIKALKGQVVLTTHYMEEAQELSDEVIMIESGRILSKGTVSKLMMPFKDKVRVESRTKSKNSYRTGNVYISYVDKHIAESFVMSGDVIKPVTLDDLFIKRGVNLES